MHTHPPRHRRTDCLRSAASIVCFGLWMISLPAQDRPEALMPTDRLEAFQHNRPFPECTQIYTLLNPAIRTLQDAAPTAGRTQTTRRNPLFIRGSLAADAAAILNSAGVHKVPRSASILQESMGQALKILFDGTKYQECDSLKGVGEHNRSKTTPALLCAIDATVAVGADGLTLDLQLSVRLARVTYTHEPTIPRVMDLLFADQAHSKTVLPRAPSADQPEAKAEYAKLVESRFAEAVDTARNQIMLCLLGYPRVFDRDQAWSNTTPAPTFGGTLRGGNAR